MKKIILLGGSNSLLVSGLSAGLVARQNDATTLTNLSLGGTSSVQNLLEVVANEALIADSDFVVTESNINDIKTIGELGIEPDIVLANIDRLCARLASLNRNVLIAILPMGRLSLDDVAAEAVRVVNDRHRANAERYGFFLVDIEADWAGLAADDNVYAMADRVHPLPAFMYALGQNIARFVEQAGELLTARKALSRPDDLASLRVVSAADIDPKNLVFETNSLMHKAMVEVGAEGVGLPETVLGHALIGIGTWGPGFSALRIGDDDRSVTKAFGPLNAFNELTVEIVAGPSTRLQAVDIDRTALTERSIGTPPTVHPQGPTRVTDILFHRGGAVGDLRTGEAAGAVRLESLTPDIQPLLKGVEYYVRKRRLVPAELMDADLLASAAAALEPTDPAGARTLLEIASRLDPDNAAVRLKLKARQTRLDRRS